jgi:microcystin-dependent protein
LFAAIGTLYGVGDGSTTFNLPDLRGEFVRGFDDGRGVDTGRTMGSNQAQNYQSHNHLVSDPGHSHTYQSATSGQEVIEGSGRAVQAYTENTSSQTTGITIQNNGGTETRPRNIALLGCIKT